MISRLKYIDCNNQRILLRKNGTYKKFSDLIIDVLVIHLRSPYASFLLVFLHCLCDNSSLVLTVTA